VLLYFTLLLILGDCQRRRGCTYTRGLPAFLEYFAENGAAVTVLGHDRTVPSSMSELMLAFLDRHARRAGDGHRRAGVLRDELELAPSERVHWRRQEQVGLRAERVRGHHLSSMCQVPATSHDNSYTVARGYCESVA